MDFLVVNDFFDNFNAIKEGFKQTPLFSQDEYNEKFSDVQTWPGYRSQELDIANPFLNALLIKELKDKIGYLPIFSRPVKLVSHLHLRLEKDQEKDWIHKDLGVWTVLIYLNETNLKSTTDIYDEDKNCVASIKYVQNRMLLFNGNLNHSATNHFGTDISNGRLTLNCFIEDC